MMILSLPRDIKMKYFSAGFALLLALPFIDGKLSGSFEEVVVQGSAKKVRSNNARGRFYSELLHYAKPYTTMERDLADTNSSSYDYDTFAFDVYDYSFKYVKCQAIRSFSDNLAKYRGDGYMSETVLAPEQFVVFRFCPSASCSNTSTIGCSSDYGEYILKLEDYLTVMYKYNLQRKENFCDYCTGTCGYRRLQADDGNAGNEENADNQEEEEDQEQNNVEENAENYYEAAKNDDAQNAQNNAAGDDQAASAYSSCDACSNYTNICENNAIDYSNYLQCQQVEDNYGNAYYVGPSCSSNGRSIVISVFSDQYCYYPISNKTAASVTGVDLQNDGLAEYYPSNCTSCGESDLPWEQASDDAKDQDKINGLCENLFYDAGKCNNNYKYHDKGVYGGYKNGNGGMEQVATDSLVCSFIQNVLSGYDESGEIDTRSGWFTKKSANSSLYAQATVTTGQVFGLIFSVIACTCLAGYSCFLHRAIMKKAPWRPNRGGVAALAGQISRVNSGIILGRSRSSGSAMSPGGSLA